MARVQRILIRSRLKDLIPNALLENLSLSTGFVERARKLELPALIWTLVFVLGGGGQAKRSRAALHDAYLSAASQAIGQSSFDAWFRKPELVTWLLEIIAHVMTRLEETAADDALARELAQFRELFCADSSVVRLPDELQKRFPGTRTNHSPASLKLHLVTKVFGAGIHRFEITEGRRADTKMLKVGEWVKGSLLLFDLGYYDFSRFARIDELKGYFISRVKDTSNPEIEECHLNHRGRAIAVEGKKLLTVLEDLERKVIDVSVRVRFKTRVYRGKRRSHEQVLRLVGVWDADAKEYHLYFTNLSPAQLGAEAVAQAYRQRWQVELVFRQLKSVHGLGALVAKSPDAAQAFVYAAVLALLVTRRLVDAVRQELAVAAADIPCERAAIILHRLALDLFWLATQPPRFVRHLELRVERVLRRKLRDPNRTRDTLLRRQENLMSRLAA